jgi:hypothetical protein
MGLHLYIRINKYVDKLWKKRGLKACAYGNLFVS